MNNSFNPNFCEHFGLSFGRGEEVDRYRVDDTLVNEVLSVFATKAALWGPRSMVRFCMS